MVVPGVPKRSTSFAFLRATFAHTQRITSTTRMRKTSVLFSSFQPSTHQTSIRSSAARFRASLIAVVAACAVFSVRAETWNLATGGSWNAGGNWNPSSVPTGVGAAAVFNNASSGSNVAQTGNRPVTLDGAQTVGSILFNCDAANAFTTTISGGTGGSLTFDATDSGPATISVPVATGTGNFTISGAMVLNDSVVATVNDTTASSSAGALNLTGAISGSGGFTKQGDGLCTFGTGAKTYTGATYLSGGRLRMSLLASASQTASFTISGGTLDLISGGNYTFGNGPLNLNGTGALTGPYAVFPGAIRNDTGLTVTINNAVVLQSDTLLHVQATAGTGTSANPTGSLTFTQTISGSGKLTLTAPNSNVDLGSLILSGANTYSGGTLINGGILVASNSSATFGTGNVTIDNSASPSSIARLTIQSGVLNAIADTATLTLKGGGNAGVADQGYADLGAGVNETVGALVLGGVTKPAGTYGSSSSSATFKDDEYFTGTGIITVAAPATPPTLSISLSNPDVVVSWPTNDTGFTLKSITALGDTNWQAVANPVVVSGTNNTVTISAAGGPAFFRLDK